MKYKNIYIVVAIVCIVLILVFTTLIIRRNRISSNLVNEVSPTLVPSQPYRMPTSPGYAKLKENLKEPVIYKDITIEYRPKSDTFVVFYSGDRQKAEETLKNFFMSNNVTSLGGAKVDYESLDMTLPPHG